MQKKIDKSIIDDMTSLRGAGPSILDIRLGDLIPLLGAKGQQYDWLMDVLVHPKKRERTLREWKQRTLPKRHGKEYGN